MTIQLDYPLTRSFPGKWFGPLSLSGAFIAIVFLSVINVVLVGYDTVTVFKDNYHAKDTHWFDDFMPSRSAKQKCDAAFYKSGDTLQTNSSIFEWRVESIVNGNAATGLSYKGENMDGCDLSSLLVNGALSTWTIDVTALVRCNVADKVEAHIKTEFAISALPGKYESLVRGFFGNVTATPRLASLQAVSGASSDLGTALMETYLQNSTTTPIVVSLMIDFPFCPSNSGGSCLDTVPQFNISRSTVIYANNTLVQAAEPPLAKEIISAYVPIFSNFAQVMYAAVRVDLGNSHQNNILLNPSVIDATLSKSFAPLGITSPLYLIDYLNNQTIAGPEFTGSLPLSSNFGPSHIESTYLCRFERLKQPGSLFMSVLVATLSTFSSAWGIYLTIAAVWLKRRSAELNCCESHEYSKVRPASPGPVPPGFPMPRGYSDKAEYEHGISA